MSNEKKEAIKPLFSFPPPRLQLNNVDNLLSNNSVVEVYLSLGTELNLTFLESKESMILSHTNVLSRKHVSASLSYDNLTDTCDISVVNLHTQVLWAGISSVFRGSSCFFCSHSENQYIRSRPKKQQGRGFRAPSLPTLYGVKITLPKNPYFTTYFTDFLLNALDIGFQRCYHISYKCDVSGRHQFHKHRLLIYL